MKDFYFSSLTSDLTTNEIVKVGSFEDMNNRKIVITKEHLDQMVANFNENVMNMSRNGRVNVPVNYGHDKGGKAAGWIHSLSVIEEEGVHKLMATTEWVGEGKTAVEEGEYSFISAEIDFDFLDRKSGETFGAVLKGAGLTNVPAVKGMEALLSTELENINQVKVTDTKLNNNKLRLGLVKYLNNTKLAKEKNLMDFEELLKLIMELPEDQKMQIKEVLGVKPDISADAEEPKDKTELSEDPKKEEDKPVDQSAELSEANKKIEDLEKENREKGFEVMLSQGKAVEAQREAYMAEDMDKFAENSVNINLSEEGSGQKGKSKTPKTKEEAEAKIIELASVRAKEKGTKHVDEYSGVMRDNSYLADIVNS